MRLDSIVIGSEHADELKEWYGKTFDATEDDDGAFVFGDVRLFVFPHSDVHGQTTEPGRILINFRVDDARAVEERLRSKGVRIVRPVSDEPFGLLGTFADRDGNYLQIVQPASV